MFSRAKYTLKQSVSQIGRNKGMNITAVLAISAMMLILGLFFVAFVNVDLFANVIKQDYNIVEVFLNDNNTDAVNNDIGSKLKSTEGVDKVEFRSKADAIKIMKSAGEITVIFSIALRITRYLTHISCMLRISR